MTSGTIDAVPTSELPPAFVAARRRARRRYAVVVTVAVLAVAVTMGLVIGTGEAAHATLVTGTAAPTVPGGTIRSTPTTVWRTGDRPAGDTPLWVGTVVTWSQHRIVGRDAATGAVRWSYTRTDLTVCDAAQRDGRAFVLFGRDGDCDEISTFDAQTGRRDWFRTLPDSGAGRLQFGSTGLVIAYATSFHAMRADIGIDRFPSVPTTAPDCRFTAVVAGSSGVVTSERCPDGTHLALWDDNGADGQAKQLWRVGVDAGVVAVAATDVAVEGYDPVSGALTSRATTGGGIQVAPALQPAPSGPAGPTLTLGDAVVLELGDRVYVLAPGGDVLWSAGSTGPPSQTSEVRASVVVPTADGADLRDATTGSVTASYTVPGPSGSPTHGGTQVFVAGGGLLAADPSGLSYLR